jgi:hypothetical protein
MDRDLVKQIPGSVGVHEAFTPEIVFGDTAKLWTKFGGGKRKQQAASAQVGGFSLRSLMIGAVRRVLCPEPEILWVPFALRKARRLMRRHNFDVALVTVPPFSALVVGSALKREFPSIVLVSDFRDEWLGVYLASDLESGSYRMAWACGPVMLRT